MWFPTDGFALLVLSVFALAMGLASRQLGEWAPVSLLMGVVLAGGLLPRVRSLLLFYAVVAAVVAYELQYRREAVAAIRSVVMIAATAALLLPLARARNRLGVQGTRGESMLFDLRHRLRAQGRCPRCRGGGAPRW